VWRVPSWNLARYDILDHAASPGVPAGLGVVEGGVLPYQPWAAEKQQENYKNSRTNDPLKSADPLAKCYIPGVPRYTYLGFPLQILQSDKYVAIVYEWMHQRRFVYFDPDGRIDADFFMGDSRGRWDGNSLVIDVRNFTDRTWFDAAGNFHSRDMILEERYTPIDANRLRYEVTVNDPKVFTRPWKMDMELHRQTNVGLLEYQCHALLDESGIPLTWPREVW
jgi:hypothetical protein